MKKRLIPATIVFVMTIGALLPSALNVPQFGDESHYAWSAAYFGGKVAAGDFRSVAGDDPYLDPGWAPTQWWSLTQPMGTRFLYAIAMGLSGLPGPSKPYDYAIYPAPQPETDVPTNTLLLLRGVAILCAALGLAFITLRLGWRGLFASSLFLAIPHVRIDLMRAWAEGPLLFGCGLAVLTYGSRWFILASGLAVTFKLTALPLWLLSFRQGLGRSRYAHILAFFSSALVWSLLTPPSWFMAGPFYLLPMIVNRVNEFRIQLNAFGGYSGLLFGISTHLLWPFELVICVAAVVIIHWLIKSRSRASLDSPPQPS